MRQHLLKEVQLRMTFTGSIAISLTLLISGSIVEGQHTNGQSQCFHTGQLMLSPKNTNNTSECPGMLTAVTDCPQESEQSLCKLINITIERRSEVETNSSENCTYTATIQYEPAMPCDSQLDGVIIAALVILSLLTITEAVVIVGLVARKCVKARRRSLQKLKARQTTEVVDLEEFKVIRNGAHTMNTTKEVQAPPVQTVVTDADPEEPPPVNEDTLRRMLKSNSKGRLALDSRQSTRSNSFQRDQVPPYNERVLPTPYEDIGAPRFGSPLSPTDYLVPTTADENPYQQVTLEHTDGELAETTATTAAENTGDLRGTLDCAVSLDDTRHSERAVPATNTSLAGKSEGIYHTLEAVTEEQQATSSETEASQIENPYHVLEIWSRDEDSTSSTEFISPIHTKSHAGLSLSLQDGANHIKKKRLRSASELPIHQNTIYYTLEYSQLEKRSNSSLQERSRTAQKRHRSKQLKQYKSNPTPLQTAASCPKTSQYESCNPSDNFSEHHYQTIQVQPRPQQQSNFHNHPQADGDVAVTDKQSSVKGQNYTQEQPKRKTGAENLEILEIGDSGSVQNPSAHVPAELPAGDANEPAKPRLDYFTLLVDPPQDTAKHDYCSLLLPTSPGAESCTDVTSPTNPDS